MLFKDLKIGCKFWLDEQGNPEYVKIEKQYNGPMPYNAKSSKNYDCFVGASVPIVTYLKDTPVEFQQGCYQEFLNQGNSDSFESFYNFFKNAVFHNDFTPKWV